MAAFNSPTLKAMRTGFLASVCGLVWALGAPLSHAQVPEQPSVEVNLEALRGLEAAPATLAPPTAPIAPAPVQRIVPIENLPHVPAQAIPAPVLAPVKEIKAKSKPVPKAKASKVENIAPAEVLAPIAAPLPIPVVIPTPAPAKVVAPPALLPPPVPAPAPVAQPTPVVPQPSAPKPVNPNTWQNTPLPTVVPNTQLPAVSATEKPPSTVKALQPRKGDVPPLPAAVLPSLGAPRPNTNTTSALPLPKLPESPAMSVPAAVPEKAVIKEKLPVVVTPPKPKPIKKDAVLENTSDFEKALTAPAAPTISTAPMMVPVPSAPPTLPPSVTKRLEKTFAPEPEKQGIIKDVKTIANAPVAPVKAVEPAKVPAPVIAVEKAPAVPALPLPAPAASIKAQPAATIPALPKLPEPTKVAEPVKALVPVVAPVVKKDVPALPPVLPLPAPAVMTKPEPVKPLPLPKSPEPVKQAIPVVAPAMKNDMPVPEKLPPAELPAAIVTPPTNIALPPKADAEPIVLPKSEIASLPKIDSKPAGSSAVAALPKPPSATEVAKTPVAAVAKPVLPTLPKLPGENTLSMPAKQPLPSLTAITGDALPSTSDILQPKDAISAAPLAPALPALPAFGAVKAPSAVALPDPAKLNEVAKNEVVPSAKVVPPLPAIAPVAASGDKASRSISYAKNKVDLSDSAKAELSELAETLKNSQGNVRVVAYAGGTAEEASVAKKTSYARGLQIRAFLIEKGVNKLNVNVQALGNNAGGGNADRADIFVK